MSGSMKTPGVYIVENNDFPNSVVEVATAVPAFIGYTEKAVKDNRSLLNMPMRISSLQDFTAYFGGAPDYQFELTETAAEGDAASAGVIGTVSAGKKKYTITQKSTDYCLFRSLLLFLRMAGIPAISFPWAPIQTKLMQRRYRMVLMLLLKSRSLAWCSSLKQ